MKPVSNDTVVKQLQWRYAVKKFDPTRRIAESDWRTLEEALVLTPSSFGLQPWKFIVVTNAALKEQLMSASWNQRQLADASHAVVFAIRRDLSAEDIDRYVRRTAEVRGVSEESLAGFRKMMVGSLTVPRAGFDVNHWASNQVYIALGNFMTSAAMLGIDTCPMEGIEPAKYDEILGLSKEGYATTVVATAGCRAVDDKYATFPKVRFAAEDVIRRIA